ncbi:MAG: hypothetical protein ACT4TC_24430 [Myxococcaceae bacterium]
MLAVALTGFHQEPPDCITEGGLPGYGTDECAFLSAYEPVIAAHAPPGFTGDLRGRRLVMHPAPWDSEIHQRFVRGYTDCWAGAGPARSTSTP